MQIEDCPIELWLEFFKYISSSDLVWGWFGLNSRLNYTIQHALLLGVHTFDLDERWSYSTYVRFTAHAQRHLAPYVRKIVFRDTFASRSLISSSIRFPRRYLNLHRLILCDDVIDFFPIGKLRKLSKKRHPLCELIIQFSSFSRDVYEDKLEKLLEKNILFHTIRLNMLEDNCACVDDSDDEDDEELDRLRYRFGDGQGICLANTVRLTLTLQRWSNWIMLMQAGRLPLLEEIDVTIENEDSLFKQGDNNVDRLLQSVDLSKIRSLRLCDVTLDNVRDLLRHVPSLNMKLESLSLVRIRTHFNDNTTSLHSLIDFRTLISSRLTIQLHRFQLVLHIPLNDVLLNRVLNLFQTHDNTWPWPSMCHQAEYHHHDICYVSLYALYVLSFFLVQWLSSTK